MSTLYNKDDLQLLSTVKVTQVEGKPLQTIIWDSVDIFELNTLIPIADGFGEYPPLSKALVERSNGATVNTVMVAVTNKIHSIDKYGALEQIVLPKVIVDENPMIQLQPLQIEHLSYIPFIEGGKKFIMMSIIEYGRPKDAVNKDDEEGRSLSHRYVYRCDNPKLKYVPSYKDAVNALFEKCLSN